MIDPCFLNRGVIVCYFFAFITSKTAPNTIPKTMPIAKLSNAAPNATPIAMPRAIPLPFGVLMALVYQTTRLRLAYYMRYTNIYEYAT